MSVREHIERERESTVDEYERSVPPESSLARGSSVMPYARASVIIATDALTRVAFEQHGAVSDVGCAAHVRSASPHSRAGYERTPFVESKSEHTKSSRERNVMSPGEGVRPTYHEAERGVKRGDTRKADELELGESVAREGSERVRLPGSHLAVRADELELGDGVGEGAIEIADDVTHCLRLCE